MVINNNNGWKTTEAEFRGFTKAKLESLENNMSDMRADLKQIKKILNNVQITAIRNSAVISIVIVIIGTIIARAI